MLSLAVMATAMVTLGIATGFERRYGVLKRLGSTPLSRGGLLAAKTATVLALRGRARRSLIVAHRRRARLGTHRSGSCPRSACCCVGTVAFAGIGLLMAGTLRAEANLAAANALFLVLLFLGGMAYPLSKLPGALQAVAKVLPAAALSETVRGVLSTAGSARRGASSCSRCGRSPPRSSRPATSAGRSNGVKRVRTGSREISAITPTSEPPTC